MSQVFFWLPFFLPLALYVVVSMLLSARKKPANPDHHPHHLSEAEIAAIGAGSLTKD